ncbi:MAG: hypothetical protein OQL08_09095 [Gammaproteobacteria bacterium]|nr:hypothetical protein [Gammaproteobacteria bacterium]
MTEVIVTSTSLTLFMAFIALFLVWMLLRLLDISQGRDIHLTLNRIHDDPRSAALYLGLRFMGACLLVGLVIS